MIGILLVLAALAAAVPWFVRSTLFPRRFAARAAAPPPADAIVARLDAGGDEIEAWFLPALDGAPGPRPLLLFAHGNAELIDLWPAAFEAPRRLGLGALLVEYPGYGRSTGRPSERSIARAMVAAFDWAVARPEVDPERVVGYGRSVGGGAVCALARERPLAALVLESSFTGVRDLARGFGVPGFLVLDPFDNLEVLRAFRGPVLIVHGEQDEVAPVAHARQLAAAARGSRLELKACGHNDCPRPWPELERFLISTSLD